MGAGAGTANWGRRPGWSASISSPVSWKAGQGGMCLVRGLPTGSDQNSPEEQKTVLPFLESLGASPVLYQMRVYLNTYSPALSS